MKLFNLLDSLVVQKIGDARFQLTNFRATNKFPCYYLLLIVTL